MIQSASKYLNYGAPKTNRTSDLPLRRGLLYPLSYRGAPSAFYSVRRQVLPCAAAVIAMK